MLAVAELVRCRLEDRDGATAPVVGSDRQPACKASVSGWSVLLVISRILRRWRLRHLAGSLKCCGAMRRLGEASGIAKPSATITAKRPRRVNHLGKNNNLILRLSSLGDCIVLRLKQSYEREIALIGPFAIGFVPHHKGKARGMLAGRPTPTMVNACEGLHASCSISFHLRPIYVVASHPIAPALRGSTADTTSSA